MTISTTASAIIVSGTGAQYTYQIPFIMDSAADITVTAIASNGAQSILSSSTYTLTLNAANPNQLWGVGGTITYPLSGSALPVGQYLQIGRTLPLTQITSVQNQGNYYAQVTELALDTLCMEIQQVSARTGQLRGTWATGTIYNFGDVVVDGANGNNTGNYFMCVISNTAGTWSTDLAAGDWSLAINVQIIAGYATSAAASAATATTEAGIASTQATSAATSATNASNSAASAASSAASAATAASSLVVGTSTTSNTISTGSKTFTTQSGLALVSGGFVQVTSQANGANYMYGSITSYSGTTLIVNVLSTGGAGTLAAWNITLAPPINAGGTTGQIQYNNAGILGGISAVSVANGGTGDIGLTPYAVMCGGATTTGAVQSIAGVGTAGQILTSNGAGVLPTFQGGGGGLVLLATSDVSGVASVAFSSAFITSTYNKYVIEFDGVFTNAGAGTDIYLTVSTNNGVGYLATGYNSAGYGVFTSVQGEHNIGGTTQLNISQSLVNSGAAGTAAMGKIEFANPSNTSSQPTIFTWEIQDPTANWFRIIGGGQNSTTSPINNIKIAAATGNITGNFHLYGIAGT